MLSNHLRRHVCNPAMATVRRSVNVSASLVKELREKSGAPMMDCKKALADPEVNGDLAKAIDWLRAKGKARAASNADRVATEGLIGVYHCKQGNKFSLVEINSETDFVSRNKDFQAFVAAIAGTTIHFPVGEILVPELLKENVRPTTGLPDDFKRYSGTVQDALGDVVTVIRENIVIKRIVNLGGVEAGSILGGYVHGKVAVESLPPHIQMGKSACVLKLLAKPPVVSVESTTALDEAVKRLAMHVVAANPLYTTKAEVPSDVLSRETAIFREQAEAENAAAAKQKSADMLEKVIAGKVNKRLGELCLLTQNHVAEEGNPVVEKFLTSLGSKHSTSLQVASFVKWELGQK